MARIRNLGSGDTCLFCYVLPLVVCVVMSYRFCLHARVLKLGCGDTITTHCYHYECSCDQPCTASSTTLELEQGSRRAASHDEIGRVFRTPLHSSSERVEDGTREGRSRHEEGDA